MPLPAKRLDRDRVDFSNHITEKEVEQLVSNPDIRTLQCSSPVESDTWNLLNLSCLSWNWRGRSSVKIAERTHEKRAKAGGSNGRERHITGQSLPVFRASRGCVLR